MQRPTVSRHLVSLLAVIVAIAAVGCGDQILTRLDVEPDAVTVARGESVLVTATYVRDGVVMPVGAEGMWSSALPSIAAVSSGGDGTAQITGVTNGATVVIIKASDLQTAVRVTVTAPAITSITIEPPATSVPAGLQTQLTAVARLADGTMMPVTNQVAWSSSAPATASIDNAGEVTAHIPGSATITATLDGLMALGQVTVTQPRLTALSVTPVMPDVPLGGTLPLTATGTFTDGSMRDVTDTVQWSSALPAVATVSPAGVVTGNAMGSTMITAAMSTIRGSTTVNVTPPELVSIAVSPVMPSIASGRSQQFTATGTFSDTTTANLTTMVTWSSTAMAVATISNAAGSQGRATGVGAGMTTIRATMGMVNGQTTLGVTPAVLVSIAIMPASVSIPLGRTQPFTAMGTYSDNAMMNLTTMVTWASGTPAVATISNLAGSQGLATSHAAGPTQITATLGAIVGNATLNVGAPVLETLTVQPADSSLAIGANRQMRAIAGMSDGSTPDLTDMVTWTSSMPARATINAAGLAHAVSLGAAMITAQQGAITGSTTLTVTPVELMSIAVTPPAPAVTAGQTQQFTANGTYTDATMTDLTATAIWASSIPGVATISNAAGSQGLATTVSGGATDITANVGTVVGTAVLTSTAVTVSSFSPADGTAGVRPTASVSFTFTQAMSPASLASQIMSGPCAGNLQLSRDNFATCVAFTTTSPAMSAGDTVVTLVPATPLRALGRYRLRATSTAAAASGIAMTADVTQSVPFAVATDGDCAAQLTISQVYGGGGNSGAPILHDFVELHNPGPTPVDLGGKALQLTSAAGTSWTVQPLPAVTVAPGGYFLVRQAAGAGMQPPVADPDLIPTNPVAMGATSGKVALTPTTTPLSGACPLALTLDLVGYGTTASCFEGVGPVAAPANPTSVQRAAAGCTDHNVAGDFSVAAPMARNGLTAPQVCVCYVNETDLEAEVDTCNLQFPTLVMGPAPLALAAVFGRVFEAGLTEPAGAAPQVRMSFGFGAADSSPMTWPWVDGTFNVSVGNDDEYKAPLTFAAAGDYDFTARATRDGTNWTLCDIDGAGSNLLLRFDQFQTGTATISP